MINTNGATYYAMMLAEMARMEARRASERART